MCRVLKISPTLHSLKKLSEDVLHQTSGSKPKGKRIKESDEKAHRQREVKEITRELVKQNSRITMHQVGTANQPVQTGACQKRCPQENKTYRWIIYVFEDIYKIGQSEVELGINTKKTKQRKNEIIMNTKENKIFCRNK